MVENVPGGAFVFFNRKGDVDRGRVARSHSARRGDRAKSSTNASGNASRVFTRAVFPLTARRRVQSRRIVRNLYPFERLSRPRDEQMSVEYAREKTRESRHGRVYGCGIASLLRLAIACLATTSIRSVTAQRWVSVVKRQPRLAIRAEALFFEGDTDDVADARVTNTGVFVKQVTDCICISRLLLQTPARGAGCQPS